MLSMEKKKKSVLVILLNILVVILFIVAIAVGSLVGFLYFKYKINIFSCFDQINKLNGNVDVSSLVTNGYEQKDYDSINAKIQSTETESNTLLYFTDQELCAYLNHHLDKISNFKIGDIELNLSECDLQILQITLSDIPLNQPNTHYCDMNVVLKLNITSLKDKKFTSFPANVLKNIIHNELYISANCSIDEIDGIEGSYQVTPTSITINNLSYENTKSFFETINKLTSFTSAEALNQNISTALADALLGESGVYGILAKNGAQDYGWQSENNFVVYFVDVTNTYEIIYIDPDSHSVENPNITEYTIKSNIIHLQDLVDNGYNFLGWYLEGTETKVETIDAATMTNFSLYARWSIITYTVTCDLRGGKIAGNGEYFETYTIEDESFNLRTDAVKKINDLKTLEFAGWLGEDLTSITKNVTIEHGSYGDKRFYAYYEGEESILTLVVDGVTVSSASINTGSVLSLNDINNFIENKLSGYTISNWFTEASLSNMYNYSAQIVEDKTIYATANYLNDCVYFYPYLSQFNYALHNNTELTISSRDMLIAYIDYCIFYDVRVKTKLLLSYIENDGEKVMEEISDASSARNNLNYFERAYGASYGCCAGSIFGQYYGQYYLTSSDTDEIATKHFDGTPSVYSQQDYALRADDLNVRDDVTYNDFEINYIGKTLNVSTSEQLVWALENGYNPVCETDSAAESIYNQAKAVLRNICTDEMNDVEKLRAIYKWLALNVSYDQEALTTYETYYTNFKETMSEQEAANEASIAVRGYDSWNAEGVFNFKKAVCEGYAKSLLIMAKLEGIPTVLVSGNGHMWNKVYINGVWYGIDATHGDSGFDSKEIFTYTAFLFTDTYKTAKGYTARNYTSFTANTTYDAYRNTKFIYNEIIYDLFIDDATELNALINYVNVFTSNIDCSYYTLEIATNYTRSRISSWLTSGWSVLGIEDRIDSCGNTVYTLKHYK